MGIFLIMKTLLIVVFVFTTMSAYAQELPLSRVASSSPPVTQSQQFQNTIVSPLFRKDVRSTTLRSSFRMPGERMKKVGRTLTLLGGAMILGGISVYSSADKEVRTVTYTTSSGATYTQDEMDPKAALGILMIVGGVGMTVPGVLVWTKGVKKYNRYLEEQQRLSLDIRGTRAGFVYRF
jgi:hypothetical protein